MAHFQGYIKKQKPYTKAQEFVLVFGGGLAILLVLFSGFMMLFW